jgi:hypothetical protein
MADKNIFELPSEVSQLSSSNIGMGDFRFPLVRSLNNIKETSSGAAPQKKFGDQSSITFRYNYEATKRWLPSLSYHEFLVDLSRNLVGDKLRYEDYIAAAMGAASTLFTQARYKMNQYEVSRLDQNVAQIDALDKRMMKGEEWNKNIGNFSNFYLGSFNERQKQVIEDFDQLNPDLSSFNTNYNQSSDLFHPILAANTTAAFAFANNRFTITNNNGSALYSTLAVGDRISFTIPDTSVILIRTVTAVGGADINALADGANQTFDIDIGLAVGANIAGVELDRWNFKKLNKSLGNLSYSDLTLAQLFPNIDIANDTVAYDNASKTLTFVDVAVPGDNLNTILNQGDYIELYMITGGLPRQIVTRIDSVSGWGTGGAKTIVIKDPLGADIGAAVINVTLILRLLNYKPEPVRNSKIIRICWRPPMSIFKVNKALPCCFNNELEYFVNTANYKKAFVQSLYSSKNDIDNGGADYKLRILDFRFRPCIIEGGERIVDMDYYIDLNEISCQIKQISTASGEEITFETKPSVNALALAYQTQSAGTDTLYPPTFFKLKKSDELKLESYYINYAGRSLPDPRDEIKYDSNEDRLFDLYLRNQLSLCKYYDSSQESYLEWIRKGIYFYHLWPKTADDRSTLVQVYSKFSSLSESSINALLFSFYKKAVAVKIENSKLSRVTVNNS